MDNNEFYVNEVIEAYLDTKEERMKSLDRVTVKSLFRTCIESVNPELPRSSVIIKGMKSTETSYSIKLKNIRINFSFALDMILGIGGVYEGSKIMLIALILDVLRTFFTDATVELKEEDSYLIYLLHKLDYSKVGLPKECLENVIKNDSIAQEKKYFSEIGELDKSLERLELIHSIVLENGRYHVSEIILN
ncbi:hypothetical protein [Anaerosporobacter sp.]|uniref:hypothetical protein n=1 Tax=Anaerosporobacter sp. TaxID=1872529 RepID=UPI00286F1B7F|nr:hypothetical protein [Anaerosporobacter sp.]